MQLTCFGVCKPTHVQCNYINHQVRGAHECKFKADALLDIADNEVIIIADYKMKWLLTVYREAQLQFFGKSGTAWHGLMFMVKGKEAGEILIEYEDDFSDDKKEDGYAGEGQDTQEGKCDELYAQERCLPVVLQLCSGWSKE